MATANRTSPLSTHRGYGRIGGFLNIFLGNGDGTFSPVTTFFAGIFDGVPSDFVAVGDFNGDGKPDLAVVNGPYFSNDTLRC